MAKKQAKVTIGIGRLVAVGLALAVLVSGVLCCGYASRTDEGWFKNGNLSTWHWADPALGDESNVVITEGGSNKVQLASAAIAIADYAAYGLDEEETETAYTLTLEVIPENTIVTDFTWSAEFVDTTSAWAKDKNVADYLTITPTENNRSAVVACRQAFGEQIRVRVEYDKDNTVFAIRMADYVKRIIGGTVNGTSIGDGSDSDMSLTLEYGVGTVTGKYENNTVKVWLELSDEAFEYLTDTESPAYPYYSRWLSENGNNIALTQQTIKTDYSEEGDLIATWDCNDFATKYTRTGFSYLDAAFRVLAENTTNQVRFCGSLTYTYNTNYSEEVTFNEDWQSLYKENFDIVTNIGINGSELIY